MQPPLVSAVIVVRDGERFLEEAITSVVSQTYEAWELIVVDDGSTDSSPAIVRRFAERRPDRIRLVAHPGHANLGISASRNLGVRHSSGELIGFLDSDDVWVPEKTSEQVAILAHHPQAAMVYGRTQMWHSWASQPGGPKDFFYDLGVVPERLYGPMELLPMLLRNEAQTPTTCNALIRREAYERLGGFEDAFPGLYEDQVFFFKLLLECRTYVSSRCWAKYRQHPGNAPAPFSYVAYYRDRRLFLEWLAGYVARRAPDTAVARSVAAELRRARRPRRAALAARMRVRATR
jgi:glycosyltransferase involved in cell wall biosynthesis